MTDLFDHPGYIAAAERVFVIPEIPDAAPELVREGIARRRILAAEGRCPCGAVITHPPRAERRRAAKEHRLARGWAEHEIGCPAADALLAPAVHKWLVEREGGEMLGRSKGSAWMQGVLERGPLTGCEHITTGGTGPDDHAVWTLWDGRMSCAACPAVVTATPGDDYDRTCDHCGTVCPQDPESERIQILSMNSGRLAVVAGLCPRCVVMERP